MKHTRCTGQTCVGELRLSALDIGFDLRLHHIPIHLPIAFGSVGLDRDGETYLLEGTREELVQAIREAGYTVLPEEPVRGTTGTRTGR